MMLPKRLPTVESKRILAKKRTLMIQENDEREEGSENSRSLGLRFGRLLLFGFRKYQVGATREHQPLAAIAENEALVGRGILGDELPYQLHKAIRGRIRAHRWPEKGRGVTDEYVRVRTHKRDDTYQACGRTRSSLHLALGASLHGPHEHRGLIRDRTTLFNERFENPLLGHARVENQGKCPSGLERNSEYLVSHDTS